MPAEYAKKFESFGGKTLYEELTKEQQGFVRSLAFSHGFSFQEFRQVVEASRDLAMWNEGSLDQWWKSEAAGTVLEGRPLKKHLLQRLEHHLGQLRCEPTFYPREKLSLPRLGTAKRIRTEKSDKTIFGMCPVASPKTVCCNLRTIDAVELCAFGCSYCSIQTFYGQEVLFDEDFAEKLHRIELDPDRFYHIGTGQSSDSLVWGDRNGNLSALCRFAEQHPNVLLEFKTKSDNIAFFLENEVPGNIVCSWSLNTGTIIEHEEQLTPNLEQRLTAARRVADRGIRVAFHFHPMIYYNGWQTEYPETARTVQDRFQAGEVLFLSFGALTLIKPVIRKIRSSGTPTRILQSELVPDPHGRPTYPDETKIGLFRAMFEAFGPWRGEVFMYLCMERAEIWEAAFGHVYKDNEEFENALARSARAKLPRVPAVRQPVLELT